MTEPIIRDAQPADLAAVAQIMDHYVLNTVATFAEEPPTPAQWEERLAAAQRDGLPFLVAEIHDEEDEQASGVVGFAYTGWWRPKSAYRHTVEDTIYLAPSAGGRGIGSALLSALIDRCIEAGHRQMIGVLTDVETEASYALHTKLGFRPVGHLPEVGVKHGRTLGTYLLQKTLS